MSDADSELTGEETDLLQEWQSKSHCSLRLSPTSRQQIIQRLMIYYVFEARIRLIDALVHGMNVLGLRTFLSSNRTDENVSFVFPRLGGDDVTKDMFLARVVNRGDMDCNIFSYFQEFLDELHQTKPDGLSIRDLVQFLSGSPYLPQQIVVSFSGADFYPIAHACGYEIQLPAVHQDYDSFRDAMVFAVQNSRGFGLG